MYKHILLTTCLLSSSLAGMASSDTTLSSSRWHHLHLNNDATSNTAIQVTYALAYRHSLQDPTCHTETHQVTLSPGEHWPIAISGKPHYRYSGVEITKFTVAGHTVDGTDFPHDFAAPNKASGCSFAFTPEDKDKGILNLISTLSPHRIQLQCAQHHH